MDNNLTITSRITGFGVEHFYEGNKEMVSKERYNTILGENEQIILTGISKLIRTIEI